MTTKCPKCKFSEYRTILSGYFFSLKYDEIVYCLCLKCGDEHKIEDRLNHSISKDDSHSSLKPKL